jgi:hypothetical protein
MIRAIARGSAHETGWTTVDVGAVNGLEFFA